MAYTNNPTAYRPEGLDRRWLDNADPDSDPDSDDFESASTKCPWLDTYVEDHRMTVRPNLSRFLPFFCYFQKKTPSGSRARGLPDNPRLTVLSLNIAGHQGNLDKLCTYLSCQRPPIDVLLLCEASLRPKATVSIPGYVYVEASRCVNEGGGVLVALSTRLECSHLPVTLRGIFPALEYIVVEFKDVVFVSIYHPPKSAGKPDRSNTAFLKLLQYEVLEKLDCSKAIVIAGDANIDLGDNNKSAVQEFRSLLNGFDLNDFVTAETNPKTKTANDFVATNIPGSVGSVGHVSLSDHWPIISYFPCKSNLSSYVYAFLVLGLVLWYFNESKPQTRPPDRPVLTVIQQDRPVLTVIQQWFSNFMQ